MSKVLIALAGIAGAFSSGLWYEPGKMDVRTATLGAGISAFLAAFLMAALIVRLRRAR